MWVKVPGKITEKKQSIVIKYNRLKISLDNSENVLRKQTRSTVI